MSAIEIRKYIRNRVVDPEVKKDKAAKFKTRFINMHLHVAIWSESCIGLSRLQTEDLLLATKKDGSFLVRESESIPGAFTLCLLYQNKIHQYRILPNDEGRLAIQAEEGVTKRRFVSLEQLIHEYIGRGENNGLVCALTDPVEFEGEQDDDSDDEDIEESPKVIKSEISHAASKFIKADVPLPIPTSPEAPSNGQTYDVPPNATSVGQTYDVPPSPVSVYTCIEDEISRHFLMRFATLDMSSCEGEFIDVVRKYIESGVQDDATSATLDKGRLDKLREVLKEAAKQLNREVDTFLYKTEVMKSLFDNSWSNPVNLERIMIKAEDKKDDLSIGRICAKLASCSNAVKLLEIKGMSTLKELKKSMEEGVYEETNPRSTKSVPLRSSTKRPHIPPTIFEVKIKGKTQSHKYTLTVDIMAGKLYAVRPSKEVLDNSNLFTHDKILQLIKSTSNKCNLDVIIEGRKKDTYIFDSVRSRENFCQLIQQMRHMHSASQEVDQISLFIGTWNLGDTPPAWKIENWLRSQGLGKTRDKSLSNMVHDVYVIGFQESPLNKEDLASKIKGYICNLLDVELHVVTSCSLWGIKLIALCKPEHLHRISHIQTDNVKTGIANALGNKGAVGLSFHFNGTSFCFINSHLTSGSEKNHRRNQNFRDILKGLNLGGTKSKVCDITNRFHHLFWFGDLNYRLENEVQLILKQVSNKNYTMLLNDDQLKKSQHNKEAFIHFNEEEIQFPPTYRFEKGGQGYVWQKFKKTGVRINVPSWCDRILWKSHPETYILSTSYGCAEDISTSDHKPVFASFDIGLAPVCASSQTEAGDKSVQIYFENVETEIKTSCKQTFVLEFHSDCLEAPVSSKPNLSYGSKPGYCCPKWLSPSQILPTLHPIITDCDYLADQYITVAVCCADGDEYYGESVLSLRSKFSITPQRFEACLMHQGEETGRIKGYMHVKSDSMRTSNPGRRSYELIYMDFQIKSDPEVIAPLPTLHEGNTHKSLSKSISHESSLGRRPPVPRPGSMTSNELYSTPDDSPPSNISRQKNDLDIQSTPPVPDHAKPAPPPRKPRLGQSSLNQSSVFPVSSPSASPKSSPSGPLPKVPPSGKKIVTSQSCDSITVVKTPANSTISDSVLYQDVPSGVPLYNDAAEVIPESAVYSEVAVETRPQPSNPLPPTQRKPTQEKSEEIASYETLEAPATINEWLLNLGLPQYINNFLQSGWDQLQFCTGITAQDLVQIKIFNLEHRNRILTSLKEMSLNST
ncbi:unnamed protein product [Owenia fusiformis]|uniref:phosphatidylinositol-3,4,5-trisphosphate 5-phosphatase n=1 Tax=Owenia fusiformis TaxID=6347 RepID=A0A8S4NMT5_OWEFU|nr:unnamed protein product [Owenia fusiformis]